MKSVQQPAEKFVTELPKLGVIDDDLLKHNLLLVSNFTKEKAVKKFQALLQST